MSDPLVFLPGMMCDARLFAPQMDALGGMCLPIGGADTVEALAEHVLAEAPEQFALAGLSMGGIVAMEVIRQAPDRVTRLALMDTNPLAESDTVKARRGPQMDKVRAGGLASVMRDEMKPNYLADTPDRGAILDLCMEMALAQGPEVFIRQSIALMHRPDQSETLKAYDKPVLVLCGRHDALCPVHRHELMAGLLPQATLKIIDGAGHLPTLEAPDETTQALAVWLREE
ncbi:alpha/beta hydrolase [Primorskyibacter aestuariivivens]|uniref:alpha/beta fold hydrolase n=1 Tax=Primorskyibacter aestuariivivens TaxID=1888912 RepID=UPI0022FFF37C|nr:alpha/beta hydrolase [Primorskyibacter aestuariivivens]MDA7426833.1 alpha/beta hydrolase [Primorskyibacter aestuariivivens]